MSMLRKIKKKAKVEYICPSCKTRELIPMNVVKHFDMIDSDGVDNSYPPRFSCTKCNDDMVPIFYKSIHGFIHEYKDF